MSGFDVLGSCFLYGYRGSIAHGLAVLKGEDATDDIDLMGVCVPPVSYYHGLDSFEQTDWWEGNKDIVVYEARKFIRLLIKANPNVLSFLWNRDDMWLTKNTAGELLLANRRLFSTKRAYDSFVGYAVAQLRKMQHQAYAGYMGEKRKQLVAKHGFDTKNASHLIRLLRMGAEFLETGELQVYREHDREELLAIKRGEYSLARIELLYNSLFSSIESSNALSNLPHHPDMKAVNRLTREIIEMELDIAVVHPHDKKDEARHD